MDESHGVRVEWRGPVTTAVLARPQVRNAVDGPTAAALGAFRAFDADPDARVAVLWGEGGAFCPGADLKAIGIHPQACLRHDRLSMLEQDGLTEPEAMANELRHGMASLPEVAAGVAGWADG